MGEGSQMLRQESEMDCGVSHLKEKLCRLWTFWTNWCPQRGGIQDSTDRLEMILGGWLRRGVLL